MSLAILLHLGALCSAQILSVSSFRLDPDDFSAVGVTTRRIDQNGEICSLVKISTKITGFSFDAGEEFITDVVYSSPGIWLYLPSTARSITISHRISGTLYRWHFPVSLEPGRTYQMTLKSELPKPVKPKSVRQPFNTEGFSSHFLQGHIGAEICEGEAYCAVLGLSYSFMPGRFGFYTSFDWSADSGVAFFAGPSMRMLDSRSFTDWQLYAGPGIVPGGRLGVDFGTKFGWNTGKTLSRYDFAIGCQYWGGSTFVPYVGLGAEITGYSVAGIVALILCVLGGAL